MDQDEPKQHIIQYDNEISVKSERFEAERMLKIITMVIPITRIK